MTVSADQIKTLRAQTGAGVMDAKRALEKAAGNIEKAAELLKQQGQNKASKRAGRATAAGIIDGYVHMERVGCLVEVNCETDFVARTPEFKEFAHSVAMQVASMSPRYLDVKDIPAAVIKSTTAGLNQEATQQAKDKSQVAKMVEGRLKKYYQEVCLLKQASIMDPSQTIEQQLAALIGKLGENIQIKRFVRFELGETARE